MKMQRQMKTDRVMALCKAKHISCKKVSRDLGYHEHYIYDSEKFKSRDDFIYKCAIYLGTSPEYILGLTDNPDFFNVEEIIKDIDIHSALFYLSQLDEKKQLVAMSIIKSLKDIDL